MDLGKIDLVKHHIGLKEPTVIHKRMNRYSSVQLERIGQEVEKLLNAGIIMPSTSPHSSPILLVPKKSGKWWFCFDGRHLNDATLDQYFPLPLIEDAVDGLAGAYFFSTFDAARGYHQISLEEGSKPLTAFSAPQGHWEFARMPFGIKGASHTFQHLMALAMNELSFKEMLTYLDDVLVYTANFGAHIASLSRVFDHLRQHDIKL